MRTDKKNKQRPTSGTCAGAFLDGDELTLAYAEADTGRLTTDAPGVTISRVVITLPTWSGKTRPVELSSLRLPRLPVPSNFDIAKKLLEAADRADEAAQSIFSTRAIDSISYDFVKTTGNEQLYLTTAPLDDSRHSLDTARARLGADAPVSTEPRTHSLWRLARSLALEAGLFETTDSADQTPNVAVLAVDQQGYGFAIGPVSNQAPVYAPEELADEDLRSLGASTACRALASSAVELLAEKTEPAALTEVRVNARAQIAIYVSCDPAVWPDLSRELGRAGIPALPIPQASSESAVPCAPAEAAARGAALGSLAPGELTVNLSDPLADRVRRTQAALDGAAARRRSLALLRVAAMLLVAPLLVVGWAAGSWYANSSELASLNELKERKLAESRRLEAAIKKRNDANQNLTYCQELSKQIFIKRSMQPAVAQLLLDLNYAWPDGGWLVTGLATTQPGSGLVEIRGRSKTLDATTAFTASLESFKDERGANKFENIRPTVGDVSAGGALSNTGPSLTSSPFPSAPQTQPGARAGQGPFEWTIQATYKPLAAATKPAGATK